ncbi:MAG: NYN domain-containing protein [Pseudomonadota bacterium]
MPDRSRPLYAVLIDADNISANYAEPILKEVTRFGEPALRRVYGDWSSDNLKAWATKSRELGLVAHQESANTKNKNASDIGMVIDAMDILHSGRFDGFVIVSSDSDFTALANRVREQGKEVIGIGDEKTPKSLRSVCNRFISITNIVEEAYAAAGDTKELKKLNPTKAIPLIKAAIDQSEQDGDWHSLSYIGKQLRALDPEFDTRNYGAAKLSGLFEKLDMFDTRTNNDQFQIRLKRPA